MIHLKNKMYIEISNQNVVTKKIKANVSHLKYLIQLEKVI
jgi:hypothetical protein